MRQADRTGWEDRFRAYVAQNRGGLLRTATLFSSGDRHRAEDLVQTVLVRMYRSWPRIRPDTVDAYARKALVNAHLDDKRSAFARYEHAEDRVSEISDGSNRTNGHSGTTGHAGDHGSDLDEVVFAALAKLPARMRAVVVLRYLHDLDVAQTARTLGCTRGTVKSQAARGLSKLRASLAAAGIGEQVGFSHSQPVKGTTR